MSTDITTFVEFQHEDGSWELISDRDEYFAWQSYAAFGFLGGIRNYSGVEPIAPKRGLPEDVSPTVRSEHKYDSDNSYATSWVHLNDLFSFDYSKPVEDRRGSGSQTLPFGQGRLTTYREFLGRDFEESLRQLAIRHVAIGRPLRLVFWFS